MVQETRVTTTSDVIKTLWLTIFVFLGFIGFANLVHNLKCGFWCHFLIGSAD